MDKLNSVFEMFDDLAEVAKASREKRLLSLDDPNLRKKLKDAGVIP
jgi:hypothetical protein